MFDERDKEKFVIGDAIRVRLSAPAIVPRPTQSFTPAPIRPSFAAVLDSLWRDKHTGPVTVHFQSGRALTVEIPEEPQRIRLDTEQKHAQS